MPQFEMMGMPERKPQTIERAEDEVFEEVFYTLANRMVWELFWKLTGIGQEEYERVLASLIDTGYELTMETVRRAVADHPAEIQEKALSAAQEGLEEAAKKFLKSYMGESLTTEEFQNSVVQAVRMRCQDTPDQQ